MFVIIKHGTLAPGQWSVIEVVRIMKARAIRLGNKELFSRSLNNLWSLQEKLYGNPKQQRVALTGGAIPLLYCIDHYSRLSPLIS